jgi:hypothetical protein
LGLAGCSGHVGGDEAGGGGSTGTTGNGGVGAVAANDTTTTAGNGPVATATPHGDPTTTTTEGLPELPLPDAPADAAPPTTAPGTEPISIPEGALIGEFPVDVEPQGFVDVPVRLRQGQHVTILSNADDGILTHITVYGPDDEVLGEWNGGEPGVINGWTFDDEDPLPADAVYVVRVQHRRGSDEPFMLRFYGDE